MSLCVCVGGGGGGLIIDTSQPRRTGGLDTLTEPEDRNRTFLVRNIDRSWRSEKTNKQLEFPFLRLVYWQHD